MCPHHMKWWPKATRQHCLAQQCINYHHCVPHLQFCNNWLQCCHCLSSHLVLTNSMHCCCLVPQWVKYLNASVYTHNCNHHTSPHHQVGNEWSHSTPLQILNQATKCPTCFHPILWSWQMRLDQMDLCRSKDWIHHTAQCHFFCILRIEYNCLCIQCHL